MGVCLSKGKGKSNPTKPKSNEGGSTDTTKKPETGATSDHAAGDKMICKLLFLVVLSFFSL